MRLDDAIKLALENSIKNDRSYYVMQFWPKTDPDYYSVITRDEATKLYPLIFDCVYAFDAGDLLKAKNLNLVRRVLNDETIEPVVNPFFTHRTDEAGN